MTIIGHIDDDGLPPAEEEEAGSRAEDASQAQPDVVRHEDQHQAVRDEELDTVQERLDQVVHAPHRYPGHNKR